MNYSEPYWVVIRTTKDDIAKAPKHRHKTYADAYTEMKRLATTNTGIEFSVFKVITSAVVDTLQLTAYSHKEPCA